MGNKIYTVTGILHGLIEVQLSADSEEAAKAQVEEVIKHYMYNVGTYDIMQLRAEEKL